MEWRLFRYQLPFRQPLRWGGKELLCREGGLLRMETEKGGVSWGEVAPLPGWSPESLEEALAALVAVLSGQAPLSSLPPSARFCFDCACSPASHWSGACSINGLVDLAAPLEDASAAWQDFSVIKCKTSGLNPAETLRRLDAFVAVAGPGMRFRIDPNRTWSFDEIAALSDEFAARPVDYLEEPLVGGRDQQRLAEECGIPVALDESLREGLDLASCRWAAAWVVKPSIMGGARSWEHMRAKADQTVPVVVSSLVESGVGLQALAWISQVVLGSPQPAGLDTLRLFTHDLVHPALRVGKGQLFIEAGAAPDERTLKEIAHGHGSMFTE